MKYVKFYNKKFYVYTALWGVPGLLVLIEGYRLYKLPRFQDTPFAEGPAGYMCGVGLLLIGFCLWEVVLGLRHHKEEAHPSSNIGVSIPRKVWFSIAYMILFLVLVPILGFVLASGCFLVVCLRLLGCTVKVIAFTAIIYCGTLYWLVPYLGLSLPRGMLGI